MKLPVPFIGPTYQNTFLDASSQRCVNWFPKGNALLSTPGYTEWAEIGVGPNRGMAYYKDKMITVSGSVVFDVDSNATATSLGTINTASGIVSMASNGEEIMIVDGADGWYYDGSSLTQVTDSDFPDPANEVVFADGFFVVSKGGTGEFYKSQNSYDPVNWNAEFATAEQSPDNLVSMIENHSELWLIGPRTTEVWHYDGSSFPWSPNRPAFQRYGIAAQKSLTHFNNGLAWLAVSDEVDRVAVATRGYQVQRISTTSIEREWATYSTVSDAFGFSYRYPGLGHFYVLTFPSADKTWVYDAEEAMWHEWERHDEDPSKRGRHRSCSYLYFAKKHLIGDYINGKIYSLSATTYEDDGVRIHRERMGPELYESRNKIIYRSLEADFITGVGLTSGQGVDPKVLLDYSNDRGETWGNWRELDLGKIGKRETRVKARRLGASRSRIFRLSMSDPVQSTMTNAVLDAEAGSV
jgi:hypothetical protein